MSGQHDAIRRHNLRDDALLRLVEDHADWNAAVVKTNGNRQIIFMYFLMNKSVT